jgi:hypothetical protein
MPNEPDVLTIVLAVFTGLGLAAACGLRVFVPLLVLGIAVRSGGYEVQEGFAWVGSTPALVCLSVATVLEVGAFYVPFVDNLLDAVATPAAALAGALATTSVLVGLDPWLSWTLGIVAGAGVATLVHVPAAAARGASTVTTAGTANPGVATGELVGSTLVSGLAVLAPITVPMVVIALVAGALMLRRRRAKKA